MKVNYRYIFLLFSAIVTLLSLNVNQAYAQENVEGLSTELNQNSEISTNEDKSLVSEHEKPSVRTKDTTVSAHSRPVVTTKIIKTAEQAKPSASKEEDALSFNFLYYIIQKFKISDLVDE